RVVAWNRTPRPEAGVEQLELDEVLRQSDHVTVHCALSDDTRGLIGARELALLRPEAVLINTARGAIVDTEAMLAALADGPAPAACGARAWTCSRTSRRSIRACSSTRA